jgi:predicted small metal-binding protein
MGEKRGTMTVQCAACGDTMVLSGTAEEINDAAHLHLMMNHGITDINVEGFDELERAIENGDSD